MTDQLISFETAKLAKEKVNWDLGCHPNDIAQVVTQSLLQRFLLETHSIFCTIEPFAHSDGYVRWFPVVQHTDRTMNNVFLNVTMAYKAKIHEKHVDAMEQSLFIGLNLIKV